VDGPKNVTPEWQIEYSTFKPDRLVAAGGAAAGAAGGAEAGGQPAPVPVHLLPDYDAGVFAALGASGEGWEEDEEVWEEDEEFGGLGLGLGMGTGLTTREKVRKFKQGLKRITPWRMKDLTIGSYVKLARKLVAEKKMWKQFSDFM
jgi:endopolyphosphatase